MMEELKKRIVEAAKKADQSGLCKQKAGNFSAIDRVKGYVVITPSGVAREELTYHDCCVVDLEGRVIECVPGRKPSSEILMHIEAYKCRPDVNAVVHTHSRYATSFAVVSKLIPPVIYEAMVYGGTAYVAPYGRPGTMELARSVIEPLQKSDVCLLENHGVLAVDDTIEMALLKAQHLEETAEIYYRALMLNKGEEPKCVSEEELKNWKYPSQITMDKNS